MLEKKSNFTEQKKINQIQKKIKLWQCSNMELVEMK
ncbi:hypothetical protein HMPREF9700_02147 [Bergeyella zoohelcum CCUG 30536]|uniref:Uncharacterized protein n=1 Tax=Bergeyella zoohelcum TaxID=1015 RepID=A0A376C2J2_9FLAO|nr:hypothetical protein HMPREF9700_02147 [Bergeyella zoohelcum CCUG 30536]SSZ55715.1 Uncharacterised protein [Bergeyella zoohelcum]